MKKFKYGLGLLFIVFMFQTANAHKGEHQLARKPQKSTPLYKEINTIKSSYDPLRLFLKQSNQNTIGYNSKAYLNYAEFYQIENRSQQRSISQAPHLIEMTIPFEGKMYDCIFRRNHLKSSDYQLTTSKPIVSTPSDAIFYQGIVEGQPSSWATLAYIDGKYRILLAHKNGNLEVNHVEGNTYAIYNSKDQKFIPDYIHEHDETAAKKKESNVRIGSDCLELYIECDFQSYQDNGSSVSNTESWAMSIVNDVSTIYATVSIPLVVAEIFVWNSSDPYINENNLTEVRDSFVQYLQNNYNGRVAQLFSTRPLSGGLAYGLGGLCGTFPDFPGPYCISTELSTSFDPYPNYSFTVYLVAHELGHVLGARHTHACAWGPDGETQIDDCGNVHATNTGGTPEGTGCYDEQNPILPVSGGTVMSFCHLAGGGIDLSNGFGTEVGDFIFNEYSTAVCATGGLCASIPPSNDDCANAIEMKLTGECSYFEYDNIMATSSGVPNPSCGTPGAAQDVWFSITPTNTDVLFNFNPISGQVLDMILTAYSGTCGNLSEIKCEEAFNEEYQMKLSGLTPNETIYIRLIEVGSDLEGSFELCAIDEGLPCHPAINALVDLYNATNGASWTNRTGWDIGAAGTNCTPCSWYGITCDNLENVIEIDLTNNNLVGTVPSTMEDLTKLRSIKLLINDLTGIFPDIWTDMTDLEFIDLSNNQFTGSMPSSLGNLLKLNTLYIENNNLTGALLPEIGNLPNMDVYWAKGNDLSGCFPGTYLNLCDIGSLQLVNNPQLPNTGITTLFCNDGTGGDVDGDGFCFGQGMNDDCVDDDNTIYPNAPELCDGKDNDCDGQYDENIITTNTWLPAGGGDWQVTTNWSMGTLPQPCEDVIIPASGASRIITIPVSTNAFGRSLTIGSNSNVTNNGNLSIAGSDDDGLSLDINADFINNGVIDIFNIQNYGLTTEGRIENYGTINVSNLSTAFELYIQQSGEVENTSGGQLNIKMQE
ncbi:MAG: M12 family metallo-peptidase [Bacteroidota bacterium]